MTLPRSPTFSNHPFYAARARVMCGTEVLVTPQPERQERERKEPERESILAWRAHTEDLNIFLSTRIIN